MVRVEPQKLEVALARIEGALAEGFAAVRGELAVLRQQVSHETDRRSELAGVVSALDARVDALEQSAVTREDMEKRATRTLQWVTFIVGSLITVGGIVIGAVVSFLVR